MRPALVIVPPPSLDLGTGVSFIGVQNRGSHFDLPNLVASPIYEPLNNALWPFLRLLMLMSFALGMSVPVSAWTAHEAAHGPTRIDADTHHHHEDDGRISIHDDDSGNVPDGGHNHMPSLLLGVATLPDQEFAFTRPEVTRIAFYVPVFTDAKRHSADALRRPPRLG